MNGSTIQDLLQKQVSPSGVLTLKAGTNGLASPRIDALLSGAFGGTLTATLGAATVGDTGVMYPSASLACAGFAFYDAAKSSIAVLTLATGGDGTLDISVSADMPPGWSLTDSFLAIAGLRSSPVQGLVAASGTVAVNSADSATAALVTVDLTTAGSTLAQLTWLLGATVQVTGAASFAVDPTGAKLPLLSLSSASISGPSVSGFTFDVFVNIRSFAGPPPLQDGSWALLTSVDLTVDLVTPDLTLPVLVSVTGPDETSYPISLDPYRAVPAITSLDQLRGFTQDQSVALSADTPIGDLSLRSLSLQFDAVGKTLGSLQVSISLGLGWTPVTNLDLVGLTAQLFVPTLWGGSSPPPNTSSFALAATATLMVATAEVDVTIAFPDETVALTLKPGTSVDIDDFLAALAGGLKLPGSGDLVIYALDASADIKGKTYDVSAVASGALTVIPNFVLTGIDTALTWSGASLQSFQFGAAFQIADADLVLSVVHNASGWTISGGSAPNKAISLNGLVHDINGIFLPATVQLPGNLSEFSLASLELTYATGSGNFSFDATILIVPGDDPVLTKFTGTVAIAFDGAKKQWTGSASGAVVIDETNTFTATYDFKADKVVSLTWAASGDETVGIDDLCSLFGAGSIQDLIPPDLDLQLVQIIGKYDITTKQVVFECRSRVWGVADVVVWKDAATGWKVLLGVDIGTDISLDDVPLVGKALTSAIGDVALKEIQATVVDAALSADQAADIAKLIDKDYPTPPTEGLPAGAALVMTFDAGGATTRISVGTPTTSTPTAPAPASGPSVPASPGSPGGAATSPDGTKWFSVQKSFGPVSIQKVGVRYSGGKLWALMNASLGVGGLVIEMLGLGVGSPLTSFEPTFTMDGLAVSLTEGPLSFSGGLVGSLSPEVNLYGELSLRFETFMLGALAGYAEQPDGPPSFFLYGVLDAPLGGPEFFFVTGVAAGFGFNRALVVPDVSGVAQFPLVQWATNTDPPSSLPGSDVGRQVTDVLGTLVSSGVLAPKRGQNWVAAGLSFTSFELVDSFVLATVAFGDDIEIDILGLSTAAVPPSPSPPVAEAQLALKATIQPSTGLIGISGQLTPNSYVLLPSCKLTGGFAFYMWVSGEHSGDFVITMGGYSPHFNTPSHYPQVPRLGLNWQNGDCLSVTGDLYFAVTSSAAMAGGSLSAVWQAGDVRAWFDVQADFLMVYTPFQYYLSASIELGASVRIDLLFTSFTLSAHLGVDVRIWGPDFSGEVDVDLSIVSFTISFGQRQDTKDTTIGWDDFVQQLLPKQPQASKAAMDAAPARLSRSRGPAMAALKRRTLEAAPPAAAPAVLQWIGVQGVLKTLSDEEGSLNWLVDGETFQARVQTTIPLKSFSLAPDPANIVMAKDALQPAAAPNTDFGCGPAGLDSSAFTSDLALSMTSTEDSCFQAVRVQGNVAKSLWEKRNFDSNGTPTGVDPVNDTTIADVLTGFVLSPIVLCPPAVTPLPIPLANLQYTIDTDIQSFSWSTPFVAPTDPFVESQTVQTTIAAPPALSNRPTLLKAMGRASLNVQSTVDVAELFSAGSNDLLAQPVLCILGEAK